VCCDDAAPRGTAAVTSSWNKLSVVVDGLVPRGRKSLFAKIDTYNIIQNIDEIVALYLGGLPLKAEAFNDGCL
jgi:hypothetical protein